MEKLFKLGKRTVAMVPGLLVLFYNLWVPLEIPRSLLFGIMEGFAAFTMIRFYNREEQLKKWSSSKLMKYSLIFFFLFVLLLLTYILIYNRQNIYNSKYDTTILIPFQLNQELNFMITKSGSVNSAISEYGPEAIKEAIKNSNNTISITKLLFMVNYSLIFETMVLSFGFVTVKSIVKRR